MAESGAFELRRGDKVYRAASMDVLERWARERRISAEDGVRPVGGADWKPAGEMPEIARLLDPSNWWTVKMGDRSYIAPDFEAIVLWTREGRVTSDAVIEGPRTPPGGVLAQGLPRLAPFLRPPLVQGPGSPPRLRIDGVEYHPGDIETIKRWIAESRVAVDAEISLSGGPWEPISECGAFEPEAWPRGAWGETVSDEPDEEEAEAMLEAAAEGVPADGKAAGGPAAVTVPADGAALQASGGGDGTEQYRIVTSRGVVTAGDAREIARLLRRRRINSFDDVVHPGLPDGRCSVGRALELLRGRRRGLPGWLFWVLTVLALAVVFLLIDPLDLDLRILERLGIS